MNTEITNTNGELDAEKLFQQIQSLNSQLGDLQKEAEDANIMPTKNVTGTWIFKTEHINPEKIELLGKNAYAQALILSELYEIQMQAMQLSVGSFDALKTVNKELTKAMNIGFSESGAHNQQLFLKTQEQIKRIAVFAKNYADNLNELKQELSKDFEESLSKYAEADDVESQIKKSLKNYVNNKDFEKYQKDVEANTQNRIKEIEEGLSKYAEADDVENQIKKSLKNYVNNKDFESYQKDVGFNIQNEIKKFEEKISNFVDADQITNVIKNFVEKDEIDGLQKNLQEKLKHTEELVKNIEDSIKVPSKQKILTVAGLILGSIGTILAFLSFSVL